MNTLDFYAREYPLLMRTLALIKLGHEGQMYNNRAYWHHPVRVMLRLMPLKSEIGIYSALLHDLIEDTKMELQSLFLFGYTVDVVKIVGLVTRNSDVETYKEFIERLVNSKNAAAMCIKYADLTENINQLRFVSDDKRASMMLRYGPALDNVRKGLISIGYNDEMSRIIGGELDAKILAEWIGEDPAFL